MGEGKASLFKGFHYGMDAFVRDKNVVGEICCLEEDGTISIADIN